MAILNSCSFGETKEGFNCGEFDYDTITKMGDIQDCGLDFLPLKQNSVVENLVSGSFAEGSQSAYFPAVENFVKTENYSQLQNQKDSDFVCSSVPQSDNILKNGNCVNSTQFVNAEEVNICGDEVNLSSSLCMQGESAVNLEKSSGEEIQNCGSGDLHFEKLTPEKKMNKLIENYRSGISDFILDEEEDDCLGDCSLAGKVSSDDLLCKEDCGLDKIIHSAGSLEEAKSEFHTQQEKLSQSLFSLGVATVTEDGESAVDEVGFASAVESDSEVVDAVQMGGAKVYKCDLCNMRLAGADIDSWGMKDWVKFFLKAVKSVPFSLDYYDRLFDKHVSLSFYSEHISKFGSIEHFFEAMAEIVERKNVMSELQSFVKRLYKELSDLEIMIVDRFVFDADNLDEIQEKISLRTMYRKADKIIPKLSDFMQRRGYSPTWCKRKFGSLFG